jgi:hypothetical protein
MYPSLGDWQLLLAVAHTKSPQSETPTSLFRACYVVFANAADQADPIASQQFSYLVVWSNELCHTD